MRLDPSALPQSRLALRPLALWLVALLPALAFLWHGPIAQWPDYHAFADQRSWLGIPHAADVLSNLPFLLAGAWGLWRLRGAGLALGSAVAATGAEAGPAAGPSLFAWRAFAIALMTTAVGSAIYHWAPDNAALVGDRLPIAWACAALLCAFLAERADARWGRPWAVAAMLALATLTVAWWRIGDAAGQGDLRPYLYLQLLAMLLIPAGLLLRAPAAPPAAAARPGTPPATPATAWWAVLAFYAAAKLMEVADHAVLDATGVVSGHTLKHLLAAAGAAWLLGAAAHAHRAAPLRSGSRR